MSARPAVLVVRVCAAEALSLVGFFAFAALLPQFMAEWSLTNAQAGWISGIPLASYAVAVSVLVSLTDKIDARHIFNGGAVLGAVSLAGFAFFAEGFWSALALRGLAGVALAGAYMPGLRVLVDRYGGRHQSRAVAFYTSSFSLGTASSFFIAGEVGDALGWRAAFWVAAAAAAGAALLVATLHPVKPQPPKDARSVFDIRPVLRNGRAMAYVLGYAAHGWELFAFRGWSVAFLTFSLTLQPEGGIVALSPAVVTTIGALVAMGASIAGNELAERFGRRRVVVVFMTTSGALSLVLGFLPGLPYLWVAVLTLVYAALVQMDSASLTAGAVAASEPGRRGATLGVHSFLGFAGSSMGPLVVGIVLDATGGGQTAASWGAGFVAMGAVCLIAPLAFLLGRAPRQRGGGRLDLTPPRG